MAQYLKVVDTRLEANSENQIKYVVEEGAQVVNYTQIPSNGASNSSASFNLNNVGDVVNRDPRIMIAVPVTLTLNVTNTTGAAMQVVNSDNFGSKQFPVNRIIQNLTHQINGGANYSLNTSEILDAITKVNFSSDDMDFFDNMMPDFVDSFANATGSVFSPLASYSSLPAGKGVFQPRTLNYSIDNNTIAPNATANVNITINFYEPLISPFCNVGSANRKGLYGINSEIINLVFMPALAQNMFCFIPQTGLTLNSSVANLGLAKLCVVYLTPKANMISHIPKESVYHYSDYQVFSNTMVGCPSKSRVQASTQNVSFSTLPKTILVYARPSNQVRNVSGLSLPDKYLNIQQISCTFDNGNPQLNNTYFVGGNDFAGNEQLWDISTRNGLSMPRPVWKQSLINTGAGPVGDLYGSGGPLVINPCLDLSVRPEVAAGSAGKYNFSAQITFQNNTDADMLDVTLYVVGISNGILERDGTSYRNYLQTLPSDVITHARLLPGISHQEYMDAKHGNSFLSGGGVGNYFRKFWEALQQSPKYIKEALGVAKELKDLHKGAKEMLGRGGRKMLMPSSFVHDQRPMKDMSLFYE
jgi:hypothetical protein